MLGTAFRLGEGLASILFGALIALFVMAYGAVITSTGLALAVWQPRLGRAVGLSVAAFLMVTVVWPAVAITLLRAGPHDVVFLWVSPFFGTFLPMGWVVWFQLKNVAYIAMPIWIALTAAVAFCLLQVTMVFFDRIVGRMPVVHTAVTDDPWPRSAAIGNAHRPRHSLG